jgi:hypothetical protein
MLRILNVLQLPDVLPARNPIGVLHSAAVHALWSVDTRCRLAALAGAACQHAITWHRATQPADPSGHREFLAAVIAHMGLFSAAVVAPPSAGSAGVIDLFRRYDLVSAPLHLGHTSPEFNGAFELLRGKRLQVDAGVWVETTDGRRRGLVGPIDVDLGRWVYAFVDGQGLEAASGCPPGEVVGAFARFLREQGEWLERCRGVVRQLRGAIDGADTAEDHKALAGCAEFHIDLLDRVDEWKRMASHEPARVVRDFVEAMHPCLQFLGRTGRLTSLFAMDLRQLLRCAEFLCPSLAAAEAGGPPPAWPERRLTLYGVPADEIKKCDIVVQIRGKQVVVLRLTKAIAVDAEALVRVVSADPGMAERLQRLRSPWVHVVPGRLVNFSDAREP